MWETRCAINKAIPNQLGSRTIFDHLVMADIATEHPLAIGKPSISIRAIEKPWHFIFISFHCM